MITKNELDSFHLLRNNMTLAAAYVSGNDPLKVWIKNNNNQSKLTKKCIIFMLAKRYKPDCYPILLEGLQTTHHKLLSIINDVETLLNSNCDEGKFVKKLINHLT